MNKLYKIAVYLLIMLGIIHLGFTPFIYKTFNADALLFCGTGLTYTFMGLYNLSTLKVNIKSLSRIAVALNVMGTIFTIAITYILREPQAYAAMFLVTTILAFSILSVKGLIKK